MRIVAVLLLPLHWAAWNLFFSSIAGGDPMLDAMIAFAPPLRFLNIVGITLLVSANARHQERRRGNVVLPGAVIAMNPIAASLWLLQPIRPTF